MNRADTYAEFAKRLLPDEPDAEYLSMFGPTPAGDASPYESFYGNSHVFMQSQQLADIGGFYHAFGVEPRQGERSDHLAVELEFLSYLAVKESLGTPEQAEICRAATRSFLRDHVGRWVRAFAVRVERAGRSSHYTELTREIADHVEADCRAFDAAPSEVNAAELRQPAVETDMSCGDCLSSFQWGQK